MDFPDEMIPVFAIFCVFGFLTVSSLSHYAYKCYSVWRLTRLKERLLDAGMTSAEIERVVNAGTPRDAKGQIHQKQFV
jgi:hypothetical protein